MGIRDGDELQKREPVTAVPFRACVIAPVNRAATVREPVKNMSPPLVKFAVASALVVPITFLLSVNHSQKMDQI